MLATCKQAGRGSSGVCEAALSEPDQLPGSVDTIVGLTLDRDLEVRWIHACLPGVTTFTPRC
jgi:hypothetical protein